MKQPFTVLVRSLSAVDKSGLWLNPFRGIPRGPRLSRFDIVYLDHDCRVLKSAENFTEAEFEPLDGETASALVLPPHTLRSFQIRDYDQLRICNEEKPEAAVADPLFSMAKDRSLCARKRTFHSEPETGRRPLASAALPASQEEKPSLKLRLLRWLFKVPASTDRRKEERFPAENLLAYYWNGGPPRGHQLGNVSYNGLYLYTEERWLPGTRIVMTLQRKNAGDLSEADITRVESRVVRWGEDGIGCEFVQSGFVDLNTGQEEDRKFDKGSLVAFLQNSLSPESVSS